MEAFADWFRWLYDATGINLTYFYDPFDRARMLKGLVLRLWMAAAMFSVTIS